LWDENSFLTIIAYKIKISINHKIMKPIYLDYNSTTPTDPRVLEAMLPYFTEIPGNPSSTHYSGIQAKQAIDIAREQVADLLNCKTYEIVFTSGATEAINLAIKGVAEKYSKKGKHIITVQTEHMAVLDTCKYLEKKGYEITYLPVDNYGLIDLEMLNQSIRDDTILVSIMYVNNETGVIHPIKEIASLVHSKGSLLMTDATQAVGKIPIDVRNLAIDLMSFSAHKFYGPKGIGGLFIKKQSNQNIQLEPILHGGGQERGLRSGTSNVPVIVGLGKACDLAKQEMHDNEFKIKDLKDYLENELLKIDGVFLNGHPSIRIYNTINVGFEGIDNDALISAIGNIAISKGSSCSADSIEPSHVLMAQKLSEEDIFSSIRISLGKYTQKEEIDLFILKIINFIN